MAIYKIETHHPIALDSRDHLVPHGAKNDNSMNPRFNRKIRKIIGFPLSVLDLGCAGGGMVKTFIDSGNIAIGIEGSDCCFSNKLHEWKTIPDNLFTADITKPFRILSDNQDMKFDLITAWEFLEHIKKEDLIPVFDAISRNLKKNGIVVCSINSLNVYWHRTIWNKKRWRKFIVRKTKLKIRDDLLAKFKLRDFVRKIKSSFHLVLSK